MRTLVIVICISTCSGAFAQEDSTIGLEDLVEGSITLDEFDPLHQLVPPADLETTQSYLREEIAVHEFSKEKWKAIVKGVNYNDENEEEPEVSGTSVPWAGPVLKLVAYGIVIAAVVALLYLLLRNISFDLMIQRNVVEADEPGQAVEDIGSLDTQTPLERAIRDGNYKLAVRLYYLSLLKSLNERGLIVWKKDKTNRDYLGELFSNDIFFDDVRKLTFSYETVWYGDHEVRPESFESLSSRFETVLRKINNRDSQ